MSKQAIAQVVERASADAKFRAQLERDPDNALAGYDLSPAERAAVLSGDDKQLRELGLDKRTSKWDSGSSSFGDAGPFS
jgi:hypothetical protein